MLLRNYSLKIVRSDCNPSAQTVHAFADLAEDIGKVLPYLNTVLKGRQYDHEEKLLTVKRNGHLITFRPQEIAMTKLEDEDEAGSVIAELQQIINETYAHRENIKPTYASRPVPRPLDIFKLLPRNNCRECEEATCMAFAMKLINDEASLHQCPPLGKSEFQEHRQRLMELLPDA
jgi:ArsR family metal-binding transcriptional regulator